MGEVGRSELTWIEVGFIFVKWVEVG